MKTKTNSFTKVINFCVLALFFISTLIFFTSCDNGNSPNDITNEEQNNTQNTDYCEICDGVQTENCGIKHKCDDENCVEYSDNRIYKNGHTHDYCNEDGCILDDSVRHITHDYCERTDCDGSTHMNADHPTTDTSRFKETPIGGEDSPYEVFVIDNNAYNEETEFVNNGSADVERKVNDYLDEYIKCINSFPLNKELTGEIEIPTTAIKNMAGDNAEWRFDALIGTISKNEISTNTIGINDVCKPAIETITKNIGITSNNPEDMELDKVMFELYYRAIDNEVYNYANSGTNTYTEEKDNIEYSLSYANQTAGTSYKIYKEDGTIHQEALQRFDDMINAAATKLKKQGKQVEVKDLYNIINLSFTASSIEGIHDYLSSTLLVNEHKHTDECYNNEMVDVIGDVDVDEMTPIA